MKKQLQLSIPQPCSENWDKMTPNERGRHCSSCNKTIIDFSLYSDRQLIEFIEKAQGKICGRLSPAQVNRPITYTEPRNNFLYKLLFGSALTVGITCSANANYNPNQRPLIEQCIGSIENDKEYLPTDSLHKYIQGIVIGSSSKDTLPFAEVLLTYNGVHIDSTYTDINGHYKLLIPESLLTIKLSLSTSYVGYSHFTQEFIPKDIKRNLDISLKEEETLHSVGIIVHTESPAYDRSNAWDKQTIRPNDTPYK